MGVVAIVDNEAVDRSAIVGGIKPSHSFSSVREFASASDVATFIKALGASQGGQDEPCLFVIDLQMEDDDSGKQLVQLIRKQKNLRKVPVVITSTSDRRRDIHDAYDLGANSFVLKAGSAIEISKQFVSVFNYWSEVAKMPCRA